MKVAYVTERVVKQHVVVVFTSSRTPRREGWIKRDAFIPFMYSKCWILSADGPRLLWYTCYVTYVFASMLSPENLCDQGIRQKVVRELLTFVISVNLRRRQQK